jgi:plastocyanin
MLASMHTESILATEIFVTLIETGPYPQDITVSMGDTVTWVKGDPSPNAYLSEGYFGEWSLCTGTQQQSSVSLSFETVGAFVYRTFYAVCSPTLLKSSALGVGTITVKAWTNSPPAITLSSPIEGFYYDPGAPVPLVASVTNQPADVLAVDFYSDSDWLGCVFTPPYQASLSLPPGAHALTAQVTDMAGNVTTSVPVNITVFPVDGKIHLFIFGLRRLEDGAVLFHYASPADGSHYTVLFYDELGGPFRGGVNSYNYGLGSGTALDVRATNAPVRFYQMTRFGPP